MFKIKRSLWYLVTATDLCIDATFSAISDKIVERSFLSSFFSVTTHFFWIKIISRYDFFSAFAFLTWLPIKHHAKKLEIFRLFIYSKHYSVFCRFQWKPIVYLCLAAGTVKRKVSRNNHAWKRFLLSCETKRHACLWNSLHGCKDFMWDEVRVNLELFLSLVNHDWPTTVGIMHAPNGTPTCARRRRITIARVLEPATGNV